MIKCDTQCWFLSADLCFSASGIGNPAQHSTQGHDDLRPCYSEPEDGFVGGGATVLGHFQKRTTLQINATDLDALTFILCEI